MALTAHAPTPPSWGRWSQQPASSPTDYVTMMDPSMLPYDSRSVTSAPVQRPLVAPQYFNNQPYSSAPVSTMPAPHYQPQVGFSGYSPYQSSPPPPVLSSFKHDYRERPHLQLASDANSDRNMTDMRARPARSPSTKSLSQMVPDASDASVQSAKPRVITASPHDASHAIYDTSVDRLMRAAERLVIEPTEVEQPAPVVEKKQGLIAVEEKLVGKAGRKQHACTFAGCNKTFGQKTHLDTHYRKHVGNKPYYCGYPGCGYRATQPGNLKTHIFRHTGEKPYACPTCGRRFAQRGNVYSHLKTHDKQKPFVCQVGDCDKKFVSRGNLKQHQNKFHIEVMDALMAKVSEVKDQKDLSPAEHRLLKHLMESHPNCNKGIKGRGVNRKVSPVSKSRSSPSSPMMPLTPASMHSPYHAHSPPVMSGHHNPQPSQHQMAQHNIGPMSTQFIINRPNVVFDMNNGSHTPHSSANGSMYDEDQTRDHLAFGDRMY